MEVMMVVGSCRHGTHIRTLTPHAREQTQNYIRLVRFCDNFTSK